MTGRPTLRLVPDEPDQLKRLAAFRNRHPRVSVRPGEFGTWEALIPEPDGERFVCRHLLGQLLDKLDKLLGDR
jgi:hypothetical protein